MQTDITCIFKWSKNFPNYSSLDYCNSFATIIMSTISKKVCKGKKNGYKCFFLAKILFPQNLQRQGAIFCVILNFLHQSYPTFLSCQKSARLRTVCNQLLLQNLTLRSFRLLNFKVG